ncbi:MAG: CRISPR-associated endonuclease Cas6 [Chitinophagales bacterium]|nr:CRISPR-associated endonuclease Cas6 [Chitinophagales bacterium]MDW8420008.1 CRISPR-associated endonuclease Cas6 [Chitinophagales bacterium]
MQNSTVCVPVGTLTFEFSLPNNWMNKLRGAINQKIDAANHPLFNNHRGDEYVHENSLLQYKIIDGRAAMVAIGEGAVSELKWFAGVYDGQLRINNSAIPDAAIHRLLVRPLHAHIAPELVYCYTTPNWVPFDNIDKRREFEALHNDLQRLQFLEKLLVNHLVTLYKSIGAQAVLAARKIQVRIMSGYERPAGVFFIHGHPQQTFAIRFYTNARLCSDIGIGNAVTYAAGTLREEQG